MSDETPTPEPDTDSAARQRIAKVTAAVMQKAAESLNAMANQIITNVREDPEFLGAIVTPGVDLKLDLQVPDALEHKIMVLIAECVAQDRVETLDSAMDAILELSLDCIGCSSAVEALHDAAEAEVKEITAAADEVRAAAPPTAVESGKAKKPGIVIPEGLVRCKKCGGAVTTLAKCARCGTMAGVAL